MVQAMNPTDLDAADYEMLGAVSRRLRKGSSKRSRPRAEDADGAGTRCDFEASSLPTMEVDGDWCSPPANCPMAWS